MMSHHCDNQKQIEEALRERNTRLGFGFGIVNGKMEMVGPFITTEKIDSKRRGKPTAVFCLYCPFCGEKTPDKSEESTNG
jgi:hypothetical protein